MAERKSSAGYGFCECGCGQKTLPAVEASARDGTVKGEPKRFVRGHNTRRPFTERFWAKVDRRGPNECWPWVGFRQKHGYGQTGEGRNKLLATHAAWALATGKRLEKGACVLHRCDNPPCVNPAHLFLGTRRDNAQDMQAKGRSTQGEKQPNAKLTDEIVRAIRHRHATGAAQSELAAEFSVSRSMISLIVSGRRWRHLLAEVQQ